MENTNKTSAELWSELKVTVENLEKDVEKNVDKHNVSAGIRVRKGLRQLKAICSLLVKSTTKDDKDLVAKRRAENVPEKKTKITE
jgi:hypothetical protein